MRSRAVQFVRPRAVRIADVVHTRDLTVEPRWPRWGPTVAADLAVRSMLSLRLYTHQGTMGSVNIYGVHPDGPVSAARARLEDRRPSHLRARATGARRAGPDLRSDEPVATDVRTALSP